MSHAGHESPSKPQTRVVRADRRQGILRPVQLDELVPLDHRVRGIWEFVEGLDLSAFHDEIDSVEGRAGRPAIDPAILLALWLYATLEGVGSSRTLAQLCGEHHAYQWICGGVSVEYRTLSDFRRKHVVKLDDLLTSSVASLVFSGVARLKVIAQDGMRVRASAGAASFRKRSTLKGCLKDARARVRALKKQLEDDPGARGREDAAARLRAAEDRRRRVQAALHHADRLSKERDDDDGEDPPSGQAAPPEPRVSTTDPDARVMRFADGGYRPGYNAQFATDVDSQLIVGVDVSNHGSDFGKLGPMLDQLERRYGAAPAAALVDGGYASRTEIDKASTAHECDVYAPTMPRKKGGSPASPLKGDTLAVKKWRARMQTDAGKALYKKRGATAECVNALARNRGLRQLTVRGLEAARAILLLYALAHNALRTMNLRLAAA